MKFTELFTVCIKRWSVLSLWVWLLAYASAQAQTRQVITYYDHARTQIKEKYTLTPINPPVLQGPYESFYTNGKIHSKGLYRKGVPEGMWEYYYENGHLKMAGQLTQNKKTGFWKYYFENGQLQMQGTLQENTRTGHWKYYYESGAPKSEGDFQNDLKNGNWQYFYEDGRKKADGTFVNNSGWYREFYASGQVRMEGLLHDGQSDSLWRYYYENGKLKASGIEKNGVREDTWLFFDESETLVQEGEYQNGVPNGKWRYYHSNGKIAAEGQKTEGKEEGIWNLFYSDGTTRSTINYSQTDENYREYYENGKLKAKGTVRNELHEGSWEYFYEDDGTLEGRCQFVAGKGLYKGIYKDGKPRMEGHLENDRRVGRWTLYKPDGNVAGYYEAFYEKNLPVFIPQQPAAAVDTMVRTTPLPYDKPSLRLPQKRNWHFIVKSNEYRAVIISINPLAMAWAKNPGLPVSLEYYMHERLGYEVTAAMYRKPFFSGNSSVATNENFSRGFSLGIKQKFYQPDGDWGMLYVAHEIRFTGLNHLANVQDISLTRLAIRANETRYEYSFLIGDRLLPDPSRKGRLTLDGFAGLGIAYRHYAAQWSNRADWDEIFSDVPKSPILINLRLGIMAGYAF